MSYKRFDQCQSGANVEKLILKWKIIVMLSLPKGTSSRVPSWIPTIIFLPPTIPETVHISPPTKAWFPAVIEL